MAAPVLKPRWQISEPTVAEAETFRQGVSRTDFSYREIGQSAGGPVPGYANDHNRVRLGEDEAVFAAACAALRSWRMFPAPWARIHPADAPLTTGTVVVMQAHVLGLWWLNSCRIVYTVDEAGPVRRFGFAYGTLSAHVEKGEERFSVELHPDGAVWYDLKAFSRPHYWPVRLAGSLARKYQRKFVRESQAAMRAAVASAAARR